MKGKRTRRKRNRAEKGVIAALDRSPINYFSDLFIAAMVTAWIVILIIMTAVAIYATVRFADTSIWPNVCELTGIPLTAGGAIWMIKNGVQHAIANSKGKNVEMDFPPVPGTEIEYETNTEEDDPEG